MGTLFDKNRILYNFRPITLVSLIILLVWITIPSKASAHAYSASYTKMTVDSKHTVIVFTLDTLSVIELVPHLDANKNFVLEKSEINKNKHHLEELIEEGLTLDKGNEEQTPTIESMKLVKKENKEYLSTYMTFPAFSPGDTINYNDGFYYHDTGTNYVDLITASIYGESSEGVLQGKERTWTVLVTEVQQEQGQTAQPDTAKVHPEPAAQPDEKSAPTSWFSFFKLGMLHILTGYDHLLFLLALLLRKQTFKQYAAIVTAFTIAHSITLSLAVLGWVTLPSRFVEAVIAFSICYVALENIFRKEIRYRWSITFLFGLIHGLGFATILKEMSIANSHLAVALLNFNLGIEAVQLSIVLVLLPLLSYLFKLRNSGKIVTYGSYAIVALGAIWLFQRLFQ
ncbi:hydrogenase/urease accessory protein HupE [Neobacillus bataviensis]|uniref:Hydrogenase/urease accessory protein HupE n=1 Tax=Neobacillus bataviensis TaxID=220685 RepID=A0A561CN13_9BACI|nr:HupE/UreJ family protein [Neobacillus bataviensis]TWD92410.1 hydrogenase/urease accessory protein HupE [Neobacillus bataviensis]